MYSRANMAVIELVILMLMTIQNASKVFLVVRLRSVSNNINTHYSKDSASW
jgi:hypothetical protein